MVPQVIRLAEDGSAHSALWHVFSVRSTYSDGIKTSVHFCPQFCVDYANLKLESCKSGWIWTCGMPNLLCIKSISKCALRSRRVSFDVQTVNDDS